MLIKVHKKAHGCPCLVDAISHHSSIFWLRPVPVLRLLRLSFRLSLRQFTYICDSSYAPSLGVNALVLTPLAYT